MSGISINHFKNHSRTFLESLLKGSVSSNRADLTAVARSSGVEGPRSLCATTVAQKRRQKAKGKSVRTITVISILSSLRVLVRFAIACVGHRQIVPRSQANCVGLSIHAIANRSRMSKLGKPTNENYAKDCRVPRNKSWV